MRFTPAVQGPVLSMHTTTPVETTRSSSSPTLQASLWSDVVKNQASSAPASHAMRKVFGTVALREMIFEKLSIDDLLAMKRSHRAFSRVIATSIPVMRRLFILPDAIPPPRVFVAVDNDIYQPNEGPFDLVRLKAQFGEHDLPLMLAEKPGCEWREMQLVVKNPYLFDAQDVFPHKGPWAGDEWLDYELPRMHESTADFALLDMLLTQPPIEELHFELHDCNVANMRVDGEGQEFTLRKDGGIMMRDVVQKLSSISLHCTPTEYKPCPSIAKHIWIMHTPQINTIDGVDLDFITTSTRGTGWQEVDDDDDHTCAVGPTEVRFRPAAQELIN